MCKILIIEDDPISLFLCRKTLKNSGHEVIMSANGDGAYDMAVKYDPDIILLDVILPGKNGFDVFNELKNGGGRCASLPVIFTTAIEIDDIIKKTGVSSDYIMKKPINFGELHGLVRKIQFSINCKKESHA